MNLPGYVDMIAENRIRTFSKAHEITTRIKVIPQFLGSSLLKKKRRTS